jgi:hypothetical protein
MARLSTGWKRSATNNTANDKQPAYTLKKGITMNLSFENKVALVTGAGSGMGLVTAEPSRRRELQWR